MHKCNFKSNNNNNAGCVSKGSLLKQNIMRMSGYRICFRCDIVFIEKDKEKVMELQKGHGDWEQSMTWVSQSYCIHSYRWITSASTAICTLGLPHELITPAYGGTVTSFLHIENQLLYLSVRTIYTPTSVAQTLLLSALLTTSPAKST